MFIYANGDTTLSVCRRCGKSIILEVKSLVMHKASCKFYLSINGVWLI